MTAGKYFKIVYFAWVREQIGTADEDIALSDTDDSIEALIHRLRGRGGGYGMALADLSRLRFALDGDMAEAGSSLARAAELAIFPPVTGG